MGARRPDMAITRAHPFLLKPIRHTQLLQCMLSCFAPQEINQPAKGINKPPLKMVVFLILCADVVVSLNVRWLIIISIVIKY